MADCVIDNSGTREQTERQVRALWATLTATARAGHLEVDGGEPSRG
jgi:dephospho-CoA kinase